MAKTAPLIVGFGGGEVDDPSLARLDFELYPQSAAIMENVFVSSIGKMELAPGTKYIGLTPGNNLAILQEWIFSIENNYCLVMTEEDLRFIRGEGYVTLPGAVATVGNFSDQSSPPPSGGDPPPSGGDGTAMVVYATPEAVSGISPGPTSSASVVIEGGVGPFTVLWAGTSGTFADDPNNINTTFSGSVSGTANCTVTDTSTGEVRISNDIAVIFGY